jgi:hypothetical protein
MDIALPPAPPDVVCTDEPMPPLPMMKPLLVMFIVPPDNEPVSKPAVEVLSDQM